MYILSPKSYRPTDNMIENTALFGAAFDTLTKQIEQLGFDGVLYSFHPKPVYMNTKIQPVLQYSDSLASFVAHYLKNNYGNKSFITRLAMAGRRDPIDWWEEENAGNLSQSEGDVIRDAKHNFGIHNALAIPVLVSSFAIAGVSVMSMSEDRGHFEKLKSQSLEPLKDYASNYHTQIIMSREEMRFFIEPLLARLSDTKKKVLLHLVSGQPMKTISETHDISHRYAEKVILNMRKEFGDISTNELLYILGMVHIQEYL